MGLVELGHHSGLSPALLSKLERGRLFPTLPTLLRIALVFSVGLEFFFAGAREKPLVAWSAKRRACACQSVPVASDSSYWFESLDYPATERRFNSFFAEFLPAGARRSPGCTTHPGVEFIYALHGHAERPHWRRGALARLGRLDGLRLRAFPMGTAAAGPQPAAPSW